MVVVGGRVGKCVKASECLVILHWMLKHQVTIQCLTPDTQHLNILCNITKHSDAFARFPTLPPTTTIYHRPPQVSVIHYI